MNSNRKKSGIRKKILPGIAILLLGLFLTGFIGKSSVELQSEGPLIDLGTYVKDSPIGKGGNPESGLPGTAVEKSDGTGSGTSEKTPVEENQDGKSKNTLPGITVEITHDIITVNGERCMDVDDMFSRVKENWRVGLKVYLIDNYAEYETYTAVYRTLRESNMVVIEQEK